MAEREHGTRRGAGQHSYHKEKPCPACSAARSEFDKLENKKLRALARNKPRVKVAQCGTPAGYVRHIKLKQQPDRACRAAHAEAEYVRRQRRRKT